MARKPKLNPDALAELYEVLKAVCDFSDGVRGGELPTMPKAKALYLRSRAALAKALEPLPNPPPMQAQGE